MIQMSFIHLKMGCLIVMVVVTFGVIDIHANHANHPFDVDDQGCRDMFPNVYEKNATILDLTKGMAPFILSPGSDRYDHDDNFYVTLRAEGGHLISAVFIQARPANCKATDQHVSTGRFSVLPKDTFMTTANCLGHKNNVAISKRFEKSGIPLITLKWRPGQTEDRTIYFVATVVSNSTEFWTQIFSEQVNYKNATGTRSFEHCPVKLTYTGDHRNTGNIIKMSVMLEIFIALPVILPFIFRSH